MRRATPTEASRRARSRALDRAPARHRARPRDDASRSRPRTRSGCASASSPPCASLLEAIGRRRPAGARDRGHPLGRRGNARPDRVPGAWVRGPLLIVCLARDELLERRPGWGGGPAQRDLDRRSSRSPASETRELVARAAAGGGDATPSDGRRRSPSAPAATRCSPRRWSAASPRRATRRRAEPARHRPRPARGAARLARAARAPAAPARGGRRPAPSGRARSTALAGERGQRPRAGARRRSQEKDLVVPERRAAGSRASASTPSSTC